MSEDVLKLYNKNSECCACGACMDICPRDAIKMVEDNYGFLYPEIDKDKCLKCGLCHTVCPIKAKIKSNDQPLKVYAAQAKNHELLIKSSSGGIFSTIAKRILENKGIVFGAAYVDGLNINHIGIEEEKDLYLLQGSKYAQSNLSGVFKIIEMRLKENKLVLFSGTPCQVAGLKMFLRKEYINLLTIDLICHGVPSQRLFKAFLQLLSNKYKAVIETFKFRDKTTGDIMCGKMVLNIADRIFVKKVQWPLISYYYYFEKGEIFRDSCYHCKFSCPARNSDITLGDFWGVEYVFSKMENMDIDKGISAVLINTLAGESLFNDCKNRMNLMTSSFNIVSKYNRNLVSSSTCSEQRNIIFKLYKDFGYGAVDEYFHKNNKKKIYMFKIKQFIPKKVKFIMKKILISLNN